MMMRCDRSLPTVLWTVLIFAPPVAADEPAPAPGAETPVAGRLLEGMQPFDDVLRSFLAEHEVPGASVAVTDGGRLVLARAYGYADRATQTPVEPSSRFRIASLSKPITAVAVLKLVQEGELSLEDRALEVLRRRWSGSDNPAAADPEDGRLLDITIGQLLEHRGGWDREVSQDPMFRSLYFAEQTQSAPPAGPPQIIRGMMSQPLDFEPGGRYAYSNFGYCLLGRVIEVVSGQDYEAYVRHSVLAPMGVETMEIGRTCVAERPDDEVAYYDSGQGPSVITESLGCEVPSPDGAWCLEAMDAHGGWIARAEDLARFATRLPRVLKPETIETMYRRPTGTGDAAVYYSLGWQNRVLDSGAENHWHTGSLPGTTAILICRHDAKAFVALLNTRQSPRTDNLAGELDGVLHRAAAAVQAWPAGDLFER